MKFGGATFGYWMLKGHKLDPEQLTSTNFQMKKNLQIASGFNFAQLMFNIFISSDNKPVGLD